MAPAYIQEASNDQLNPVATFSSSTTVAGNTYLVCCGVNFNSGDVTGIPTDTEGNVFTLLMSSASPGNIVKQYVWSCVGVIGGTLDAISVPTSAVAGLIIAEFSNALFVDRFAQQGFSSGGAVNSPNVTTRQAVEILVALGSTNSAQNGFVGPNPDPPWTTVARGSQVLAYQNVTSIGNYNAPATAGASTESVMGIVTMSQQSLLNFTPGEDYYLRFASLRASSSSKVSVW